MPAILGRLFVATFVIGVLGLGSGCIVRTHGHGRGHSRVRSSGHGAHEHCHYRGGKHNKRVCHSHPHGDGHH